MHLSSIASSQTQVSRCVTSGPWIFHPRPISPHPRLKVISVQSRSHLNPTQVSRFVSPLHPGSQIHVFSLSQLNLTSIWVLIFTSHLHPVNISPHPAQPNYILVPSKHHLKPIHVSRCVSHLHPGPFSTGELYLSSTLVPYHPIPVSICISVNPGPISTPSRQIHVSWILPQSASWYLHLTYIQVTSHLHPGPPNCILVPSKHHLKPIQVSRCVSPPSRSFLNWRIVSAPPSSHITLSPSKHMHLTSIQVPSQPHPGRFTFFVSVESYLNRPHDICISPTSR